MCMFGKVMSWKWLTCSFFGFMLCTLLVLVGYAHAQKTKNSLRLHVKHLNENEDSPSLIAGTPWSPSLILAALCHLSLVIMCPKVCCSVLNNNATVSSSIIKITLSRCKHWLLGLNCDFSKSTVVFSLLAQTSSQQALLIHAREGRRRYSVCSCYDSRIHSCSGGSTIIMRRSSEIWCSSWVVTSWWKAFAFFLETHIDAGNILSWLWKSSFYRCRVITSSWLGWWRIQALAPWHSWSHIRGSRREISGPCGPCGYINGGCNRGLVVTEDKRWDLHFRVRWCFKIIVNGIDDEISNGGWWFFMVFRTGAVSSIYKAERVFRTGQHAPKNTLYVFLDRWRLLRRNVQQNKNPCGSVACVNVMMTTGILCQISWHDENLWEPQRTMPNRKKRKRPAAGCGKELGIFLCPYYHSW